MNRSLLGLVAISAGESRALSTTTTDKIYISGTTMTGTTSQDKSKRVQDAAEIVKTSDIVCFDVDSTVIIEEGIDELANFCGKGSEVSQLTKEAMGGAMSFRDALKRRLDIINPSQKQIKDFLKFRPSTISPGVKELINYIKRNGSSVFLISGGFHSLIEPVADELGIPKTNLFANKLMFYYNGEYAGFDTNQPTSRSGGKGEVISLLKKAYKGSSIVMIGDGATDLEACPPADHFIGYGGNVVRNEVQARSQYYITDFKQLLPSE